MYRHRLLVLAALTGFAATPSGFAQQPCSNGVHVDGTVTDPTGALILGAQVQAGGQTTTTDAAGRFLLPCVPANMGTVVVEADGFSSATVQIAKKPGTTTHLAVHMQVAKVETEVQVGSDATGLDADRGAGTMNLNTEQVQQQLADDPDDLIQQLQIMGSSGGGAPESTTFVVDGFQNASAMPPKNSIASIRVNPDPYSPEYEGPTFQGGRVEITTKPGADKVHGALFFTDSDGMFNATDPFSLTATPASKQRYGFELSGPITSKKSDFSLALEKRDINEFNVVNAITLDTNGNQTPLHETVSAPQRLWIGSARGDWQASSKDVATLSFAANVNNLGNQGVGGLTLPEAGYSSLMGEYDRIILGCGTVLLLGSMGLNLSLARRPIANRYVRIDEMGRAQAIQYSDLSYSPREGEVRTYLTDWSTYRYTISRDTIAKKYPLNYYFLSSAVSSQLMNVDNANHLVSQVTNGQVEQNDVEVKNVTITSMTQETVQGSVITRGTALIAIDKLYSSATSHDPRTEHWLLSVTYYLNPKQVSDQAKIFPQFEILRWSSSMRLTMSIQARGASSTRACQSAALFREREFDVFVWEDGANFDMSAEGADVVTQCSEFDLGAFFEAGNFALLHLHGEREFSLGHLTVLTQFIERHAFENGVGALFCAGAAGRGHQLVGDAVVGESLVCHNFLSRAVDAGWRLLFQCAQMFTVEFIGFANQLLVKAAPSMFIATDKQDGGTLGIESKECAKRQMFVVRGSQFLHVGKCRSFNGIDIRPSEDRTFFLEKVYGCIEGLPFFRRKGLHPFPKLRRRANLVSHKIIMRCNSYNVKLIFPVAAASRGRR
jgi:hypothetical protein